MLYFQYGMSFISEIYLLYNLHCCGKNGKYNEFSLSKFTIASYFPHATKND